MSLEIQNIFKTLESTSGTNAKIDIIRENIHNNYFLQVLDAAMNPLRVFHIKKIPEVELYSDTISLADFLREITALENREVTGNDAVAFLQNLLASLSPENAEIAVKIIRKDLRCGIGATTVNKVRPNTIPEYPCLKATAYSEKAVAKIKFPAYSQIKADGMRANIIVSPNDIKIFGRSGKLIDLLGHFDYIKNATYRHGVVLDGELRIIGENGVWLDRKTGNGILNKAIKGTISLEEVANVKFVAWDIIPLDEFMQTQSTNSYHVRWKELNTFVEYINDHNIQICENVVVNNYDEVKKHYDDARNRGEEGVIVKNVSHKWENKRSPHLVKIKDVKDCDLKIVGWNPGKVGTKWENKVGSLICQSNDGKVEVSISGFTDELRNELSDNMNDYIGKIIAVEYTERIKDKNRSEVDSLFSPRFLELREDKDTADDSESIL